jgi:hypothetical protein
MAWPEATEFLEAVQDLRGSMTDGELQAGEVGRTPLGLPLLWSGNFANVFKIHCPATGNTWALKCFTRHVPDLQERYCHIAAALDQARLPFTVDFQYLPQGILIGGRGFPALKMRWVEGLTLAEFVEEHLERPANLRMLLDLWVKLSVRLREAGIAHADLQHGNVLLVPASGGSLALRLIDYDGMYVPALAGTRSGEVGHPAYQHPQRLREGTYGAEVDRFSHLAIFTAIHCLILGGRDFWQRFNNGDNLLFREADFGSPGESDLFRCLWRDLLDREAHALVGRLILACGWRLEASPPLDELVKDGKVLPPPWEQEVAVNALLNAKAKPAAEPVVPLEWLMPSVGEMRPVVYRFQGEPALHLPSSATAEAGERAPSAILAAGQAEASRPVRVCRGYDIFAHGITFSAKLSHEPLEFHSSIVRTLANFLLLVTMVVILVNFLLLVVIVPALVNFLLLVAIVLAAIRLYETAMSAPNKEAANLTITSQVTEVVPEKRDLTCPRSPTWGTASVPPSRRSNSASQGPTK